MDKISGTLLAAVIGAVALLVAQKLQKWKDVHAQYNSALGLFDDASSQASFTASAQQLTKIAKRDAQYVNSTIRVLELAVRERSERSREKWINSLRALAESEQSTPSDERDYTRWYGYSPRPRNPECAELVRLIIKLHKPDDCDGADRSRLRRCGAYLGNLIRELAQGDMSNAEVDANSSIELAFADLRDLAFHNFEALMGLGFDVNLDNADLRVEQKHRERVYELLYKQRQGCGVNGAKVSLNGAWLAFERHRSSTPETGAGAMGNTSIAVKLAQGEDCPGLFLVGDHSLNSREGAPGELEGVRIVGGPGVQLRNRGLRRVNFQHAFLMGADFSNSDLTDAKFGFADITEARLEEADELNVDQLINAKRTDISFPKGLFVNGSKRGTDG